MNRELKEFIEISKYAGERFDLIQAGGGNSSVKLPDGTMYIKASGFYLSEIEENYAYSVVKNQELLNIFKNKNIINESNKRKKDALCSDYISSVNLTNKYRPSIETLLHSLLKKYTLHTHPIVVNSILCRNNWKEIITKLFINDNILLVNYKTPGFELAFELHSQLKNKTPEIIFLQNHGLIVTSDDKSRIIFLTEYVLSVIEKYINIDMTKYKITNELSKLTNEINNETYITYLSQDEYLIKNINNKYIDSLPFCPDKMVYCGVRGVICSNNIKDELYNYKQQFFDIPKVIIYKNNLFFVAKNTKKAKEIEEVFKFHIMALDMYSENVNFLNDSEIQYIGNWEAEKYRKNL